MRQLDNAQLMRQLDDAHLNARTTCDVIIIIRMLNNIMQWRNQAVLAQLIRDSCVKLYIV